MHRNTEFPRIRTRAGAYDWTQHGGHGPSRLHARLKHKVSERACKHRCSGKGTLCDHLVEREDATLHVRRDFLLPQSLCRLGVGGVKKHAERRERSVSTSTGTHERNERHVRKRHKQNEPRVRSDKSEWIRLCVLTLVDTHLSPHIASSRPCRNAQPSTPVQAM